MDVVQPTNTTPSDDIAIADAENSAQCFIIASTVGALHMEPCGDMSTHPVLMEAHTAAWEKAAKFLTDHPGDSLRTHAAIELPTIVKQAVETFGHEMPSVRTAANLMANSVKTQYGLHL